MAININLELTDHCNIKCPMCSQSLRDDAHGVPKRFMSWDTWRATLAGLEGMTEPVNLCPHWLGEPTIHPEFDKFVEYAFEVNEGGKLFAEFKLHTNAVRFSEERSRLLIKLANAPTTSPTCFQTIHFSIDAFSKEVYTKVKGADRREQVFENVQRFLEIRTEMGVDLPRAHIAFVVQPDNAHEARKYVEHWRHSLLHLGKSVEICWDWPPTNSDAIYLRPLNGANQDQLDLLHADTCREIGIAPRDSVSGRLRGDESF